MASRYPQVWSNGYQESFNDRRHVWTLQDNANPNEMVPSLRDSFLNNNQAATNTNVTPYQNCSTSLIDNRISSDFQSHNNLDQQFHKQGDRLQFTQTEEKQQNIREDLLSPNLQNNLQVNISSTPLSRNSELYGQTQKNHSNEVTHIVNSPRGNTSIGSLSYLQPDLSANASTHQSLNFGQTCFNTNSNCHRNTSLNSPNKGLLGGSFELDVMLGQFQGHRRTPSVYSDVSATSLQHSPNLTQQNFLDQQNSPIQIAQDPASYQDVLAIGNFSLSDPQIPATHSNRSPSHSPAISPRLNPQQPNHENSLVNGVERFCNDQSFFSQEPFPSLQNENGQALQMIPPEINVEFVSMSKQNSFETSKPNLFDRNALTPTDKGRRRALTDTSSNNTNLISRPGNTTCFSASSGPNLYSYSPDALYTLSPNSESRNNSLNRTRRRSTSAMCNRDYTLNLSNLVFQPIASERNKAERAQKHPATYQCHLCPKKFTRAYNLRSHLRTHTNERPYICSKCSKAFARQHDRKRHESLHSGEKRFICRGELKNGGQWGCGRPFARADALNRHFRSEAGRNCINPLIEEDDSEKLRLWNEKQIQNLQQTQSQSTIPGQIDVVPNRFALPAALLAQYPALAPFSWTDLPQGEGIIEENISGRSSFDASGSDYYE